MSEERQGWATSGTGVVEHYFIGPRSLCGRKRPNSLNLKRQYNPAFPPPDRCPRCVKSLATNEAP